MKNVKTCSRFPRFIGIKSKRFHDKKEIVFMIKVKVFSGNVSFSKFVLFLVEFYSDRLKLQKIELRTIPLNFVTIEFNDNRLF